MHAFERAARLAATAEEGCARDIMQAAWDEGIDCGLAPEQMADAALYAGLSGLVRLYGEDAVIAIVKGLEKRLDHGEFSRGRRLQ